MKLELKHLSPYLPYELNVTFDNDDYCHTLVGLENGYEGVLLISKFGDFGRATYSKTKPILRPLSDYKDINSKAMNELNIDLTDQIELNDLACRRQHYSTVIYRVIEICFKNHIDLFGLIDAGLAIDINEL